MYLAPIKINDVDEYFQMTRINTFERADSSAHIAPCNSSGLSPTSTSAGSLLKILSPPSFTHPSPEVGQAADEKRVASRAVYQPNRSRRDSGRTAYSVSNASRSSLRKGVPKAFRRISTQALLPAAENQPCPRFETFEQFHRLGMTAQHLQLSFCAPFQRTYYGFSRLVKRS
jgi:hypothetical protein